METLSYWKSLSNYHKPTKFKGITYQRLPYTGATNMGFTTYWVQFWYPLSTRTSQPSCRFPLQATILIFFSHLLPSTRDHHKIKEILSDSNWAVRKKQIDRYSQLRFQFSQGLTVPWSETLHSINNQSPPICRAFRSQSHSSSFSCLFLLARYVHGHKNVHQRVPSLSTEQTHQHKTPRIITTHTPSNQNLGWTNNWFYHSLTIIVRPYSYLGGLWSTFKISSFHSPPHVLHRLSTSQPFFCGDLQVAWHSEIHNLRPRPALSQ